MRETPVAFTNCGQQLIGILHRPASPSAAPCPAVAMLHGFTGHRSEAHRLFVQVARALCQSGLVVLRFDFRGSGDSEGEFEEMTVSQEVSDAVAALDFLAQQPEVDAARMGVIGLSLGGRVAVLSALQDPRIKFLILYSAFVSDQLSELKYSPFAADEIARLRQGEAVHLVRGYYIKQAFLDDVQRHVPLDSMHKLHIPTLIIHGDQDETVPVRDACQGYERLRRNHPRNQLHLVRGADHVYQLKAHTREVIDVTKQWLACAG